MKRFVFITGAVLSCILFLQPGVDGAEIIRDFQRNPPPVRLLDAEKRGQKLETVVQEKRTFSRVRRSGAEGTSYCELFFDEPREFAPFRALDFRVNLRSEPAGGVRAVGIRLADRRGEIFQAVMPVNEVSSAAGQLKVENFTESWGRNRDGRIDFPVRLIGISLLYNTPGAVSTELSTLEYHLTPAPDPAAEPIPVLECGETETVESGSLAAFGPEGCWRLYQEGSATLRTEDETLRIQGKGTKFVLEERSARLLRLEPFERARLVLESGSGSGGIFLTIRSADKKAEFTSAYRRYTAGAQSVEFDLSCMAEALTAPVYPALITIEPDSPESDLTLKRFEFQRRVPPVRAVHVALAEPILETGKADAFELVLRNDGARKESVICSGEMVVQGESEAKPFRFEAQLNPGESRKFPLPVAPGGPMFGECRYQLECRGESADGILTFAAVTPRASRDEARVGKFHFGVCSHTHSWSLADQEREARATYLAGADLIRTGSEWMSIQPEPEVWEWETLDRLVERFGRDGIELLLQLSYTPYWAAPEESRGNWRHWSRSMPDLAAWKNYVTATVGRYRGKIRFFEVWNEPDLYGFARFEAEDFVRLQKSAYQAAKAANPDAVVLTGGFATLSGNAGPRPERFHETALRESRGFYDCHSYHEHGAFADYAAIIHRKFLPLREKLHVDVPWMATETAISSINGTEMRQAQTLYKKILFAWSRGAIGYLWYDLRNDGLDPKNGEHHYGLLNFDFSPKPAFPVFRELAHLYRDAAFEREIAVGTGRYGLFFRTPDAGLLALWSEENPDGVTPLLFRLPAGTRSEYFDLFGRGTQLVSQDGIQVLPLRHNPGSWRIAAAGVVPEFLGEFLHASGGVALPGRECIIPIEVRNPFAEKTRFELEWQLPDFLEKRDVPETLEIAPGKTARFDAVFAVRDDVPGGARGELALVCRRAGGAFEGKLIHPVTCAFSGEFAVNCWEDYISFMEADPAKKHLIWQGPEDLSFSGSLRLDGDALLLELDVVDDCHVQPFRGDQIWQGDCVQAGLQFPGQIGHFEVGVALRDDGTVEPFVWNAPDGVVPEEIHLTGTAEQRAPNVICYQLRLPLKELKISPETVRQGFRFNVMVNDNDGEGREGFLRLAPGIGSAKDVSRFPIVLL